MNALIGTVLFGVAAMIIGGLYVIAPRVIEFIKSFIRWHRK